MNVVDYSLPSRRLSRPRPRLMERYRQKMFRETTEALKLEVLRKELVKALERELRDAFLAGRG